MSGIATGRGSGRQLKEDGGASVCCVENRNEGREVECRLNSKRRRREGEEEDPELVLSERIWRRMVRRGVGGEGRGGQLDGRSTERRSRISSGASLMYPPPYRRITDHSQRPRETGRHRRKKCMLASPANSERMIPSKEELGAQGSPCLLQYTTVTDRTRQPLWPEDVNEKGLRLPHGPLGAER